MRRIHEEFTQNSHNTVTLSDGAKNSKCSHQRATSMYYRAWTSLLYYFNNKKKKNYDNNIEVINEMSLIA